MKAMIFAAGLGTRLKPLTDNKPKALVEVCGTPMLGRVLLKIKEAGVKEVVVNVHHFAQMIRDYLSANNNFGLNINISDESYALLDTGGGLLAASGYLIGEEPIIVHNADILTDFSLKEMVEAHVSSRADVTLLAQDRFSSRTFVYDDSLRLKGWTKTDTDETVPPGLDTSDLRSLAFGGVSVVNPSLFTHLSKYSAEHGPIFSTTPFYAANAAHLNIRGYMPGEDYCWFDIGKPENLLKASESFFSL
ncbi:MAG: nucleotidyltransferase family protein [Paramuribaculum sp.]|nr:nucleotidyltransferase family protein [Paramuribaculum sp.]